MKLKLLIYLLISIVIIFGYFVYQALADKFFTSSGSIMISSSPSASISINDTTLGITTYQDPHIKSGEYNLKLSTPNSSSIPDKVWETKFKVDSGSQVVINYEFNKSSNLGSGEILTVEKGNGLVVLSDPDQAQIKIDDKDVSSTPQEITINQGIHTINISKEGYLTRELKVKISNGSKLITKVILTPNAKPNVKNMESYQSFALSLIYPEQNILLASSSGWVESLNKDDLGVDFLLNSEGKSQTPYEEIKRIIIDRPKVKVGFVATKDSSLSSSAKEFLDKLLSPALSNPSIKKFILISQTPTGFLNVRSEPNLSSKVVTKVTADQKYELLEENSDWYKIKISTSVEGWVSKQYSQKAG